jgi:hypothetical protein
MFAVSHLFASLAEFPHQRVPAFERLRNLCPGVRCSKGSSRSAAGALALDGKFERA